MKKLTTFITLLLVAFNAAAAIDSNEVSEKVKTSFQKFFPSASEVKWEKSGAVYFASFKLSDQNISAVYNEEGELKNTSRQLLLSQVPLKVQFSVKERYPGYRISERVSEIFANEEWGYLINVENEKNKLALRVDPSGNITVEDKTKK